MVSKLEMTGMSVQDMIAKRKQTELHYDAYIPKKMLLKVAKEWNDTKINNAITHLNPKNYDELVTLLQDFKDKTVFRCMKHDSFSSTEVKSQGKLMKALCYRGGSIRRIDKINGDVYDHSCEACVGYIMPNGLFYVLEG